MPIGQNQASYANKSMHQIVNVKISSYAENRHKLVVIEIHQYDRFLHLEKAIRIHKKIS